ncbi:MAG: substrate-binding domain-containing protein [Armatimonadota bacterium]|nr:substrate-binding domain-containing protein [Armatimonadota bacterium]MDR7422305.1 substrate-binding domain-containing protein [Armatimonadota bacterium]MDR7496269.1 substrate-binding domain-containing protein [Armatimonadota bacterium]
MGRRTVVEFDNRLGGVREARGLSQTALARLAGLSRQALHAIETGRYVPNTAVALRLARALGCAVEDLFAAPADAVVEARWAGGARRSTRVRLGHVRQRLVAWPLAGLEALSCGDGVVVGAGAEQVRVSLLRPAGSPEQTLFVVGCDPALGIAAGLAERAAKVRVHWVVASSAQALGAMARGDAHIAGTHLHSPRDPEGTRAIRGALRGASVTVFTVARWTEGLMLAPGNPRRVRHAGDLLRRGVRIVNRDAGAGTRRVFDRWVRSAGVDPGHVSGYERELHSHFAVAEAVASGLADAGPGVLPVARAYGLDFLPVDEQRYDLVIPRDLFDAGPVRTFLDVLVSRPFRRELEAIGGYDVAPAGAVRVLN